VQRWLVGSAQSRWSSPRLSAALALTILTVNRTRYASPGEGDGAWQSQSNASHMVGTELAAEPHQKRFYCRKQWKGFRRHVNSRTSPAAGRASEAIAVPGVQAPNRN
jgi:hypothetical protein